MSIDITFKDFDTMCYSNQHNIIQLIKHSVGISVEINITQAQVSSMQTQLTTTSQEAHDAFLLAENLNKNYSSLKLRVDAIENLGPTMHSTELYKEFEEIATKMRDLDRRITALE